MCQKIFNKVYFKSFIMRHLWTKIFLIFKKLWIFSSLSVKITINVNNLSGQFSMQTIFLIITRHEKLKQVWKGWWEINRSIVNLVHADQGSGWQSFGSHLTHRQGKRRRVHGQRCEVNDSVYFFALIKWGTLKV